MKMQTKSVHPTLLVTLLLACFALPPGVQAVVPPPDGGYPGGNTAEGQTALLSLTTGGFNTGIGFFSLRNDTAGSFNTAVGAGALLANTANSNTATGTGALLSNTGGTLNTANGTFALFFNTSGVANTGIGDEVLFNNTIGQQNTAIGIYALQTNTTGGFNTAIGARTLQNNTTGGGNTALGLLAGASVTTANGVVCIGASGADVDNTTWIGGVYGVTTQSGVTLPVVVSNNQQLGTISSSRRFKNEIQPMDKSSEAILGLNPVRFHYKSDNTKTPQFGLVAEEVAAVDPDLVVRDENGEIYTVRYDAVNAMLLNEFLKEHRRVEAQDCKLRGQEATIAELESTVAQQQKKFQTAMAEQRKEMASVLARLKEQEASIQTVSAQLELNRRTPRTVRNGQ